jgi:hypothetical protein
LENVIGVAKKNAERDDDYTVLLILTDGGIDDMSETIKLLDFANDLPLSVIIVGVGCDKFKELRTLDCDLKNIKESCC